MQSKPLLVFDFDGVIVDGMSEYWSSSRKACLEIIFNESFSYSFPKSIPEKFRKIRPWITHGWEMVLITAELSRKESPLFTLGAKAFSDDYEKNLTNALEAWKLTPKQLQKALDQIRKETIQDNFEAWFANHKPFPQVINRIKKLKDEGINFAVLTTKSAGFTAKLLANLNLKPTLLYGHESGSKTKVLLQIAKHHKLQGFVEDRRSTLEKVLKTPGLESLPCYLADWGYLKPNDKLKIPSGIHLLETKNLMLPLANWH